MVGNDARMMREWWGNGEGMVGNDEGMRNGGKW